MRNHPLLTDPALMPWRTTLAQDVATVPPWSTAPARAGHDPEPAVAPTAADAATVTAPSPPAPTAPAAPTVTNLVSRTASPLPHAGHRPAPIETTFAVNDLLIRHGAHPASGWRAALYTATGGRCNPGLSAAETQRRRLTEQVRTPLRGAHQVVVASLKGGIGKTTITACLGLTLAEHRGDRIIALDANPDAGTLADRLTGHVGITIRDLLDNIDTIRSWTDIAHYTSLAGRLQVLASEQDPAMSEAFNRTEYHAVTDLLRRYFSVLLTDSGTGLVHSAMAGALDRADTLVIAGAATLDAASRASKTLDWLLAHGYSHLVERAVVALSHDRASRYVDTSAIRDHFTARCHAVVDLPPDPHLAIGGPIELTELKPRTRDAFLTLAARVAEQFSQHPIPHDTTTTTQPKGPQ